MAKVDINDVLKGLIQPIGALKGGSTYPVTAADQIWVYTDASTHTPLDEYLSALKTGTAEITQVFVSNAETVAANKIAKTSIVGGSAAKCKVGDIVLAKNGGVYKITAVGATDLTLEGLASYALAKDLEAAKARITAVEGKFDETGKAKDAAKLGGQLPGYYATKESVDALISKVNGKSSIYVFDTEAARKKSLVDNPNKYKVGDTLLIVQENVPDYWVTKVNAAVGTEGTGVYSLSKLETKIDLTASGIQGKIDEAATTAKNEAINEAVKQAKTETTTQVEALKNGDVKTALDKAAKNASDIAKIKAPVVSASGLAAGVNPTATITEITAGADAGKLRIEFGIPAGQKGADGAKGADGLNGHNVILASVNVGSETNVNKSDLINAENVAIGDRIIDNQGEAYKVTAVAATTVHVGPTIDGFNLKGAKGDKGDKGEKGDIGLTPVVTAVASVNDTVGTPAVTVTKTGTDAAPKFNFAFTGLKGSDANVSGSVVPTTNVGNLKRNEEYNFTSFQDLLNKRLVSYVAASRGNGWATPTNGGTFEDGTIINITGLGVEAYKGTSAITAFGGNDGTKDYTVAVDSSSKKLGEKVSGTVKFDKPIAISTNRSGFNWTVTYKAANNTDARLSGTTSRFIFKDKVYFGLAKEGAVKDSASVLALSKNQLADSAAGINIAQFGTLTGGNYLYVVVNATSRPLVIHSGLGDSDRVKIGADIDFTNASGKTKKFAIYRSANPNIPLAGCSITLK